MAIPVNSVPQFKSVWVLSCHLLQLLPEVKLLGALPSTLEPFCALPASNVQLPEQYVILCLVCKQKRKASGVLWAPEYSSHLEDGSVGRVVFFFAGTPPKIQSARRWQVNSDTPCIASIILKK